jgi:hypothetical protein
MPVEYMIAFFGGTIIAMIGSMQVVDRATRFQQEILARGVLIQGTVLRLSRPRLLGIFPRIYFEFQPCAAEHPIRACHVDRRAVGEWAASLPLRGANVTVRYLPENPSHAVIVKLVSRRVR